MSRTRWIATLVVVLGAAAGTWGDTVRFFEPMRSGNYYIIAADFHVHAFPGDGALPRWELSYEASRRGLHAIVISNHNQTRAGEFLPGSLFPVGRGSLIIPSQEVTTPNFHMIAVGISETVDWRLPGADLVRAIHAQGGVAIAAHPVRESWKGSDDILPLLDGAEVSHPMTMTRPEARAELSEFFARVKAVNPDIAPIGSSDFHMVRPIGQCRTLVFAESVTVPAILDALRAGRTIAQDESGVFHGDPALIELYARAHGGDYPQSSPVLELLSVVMAVMGIAGLVILK